MGLFEALRFGGDGGSLEVRSGRAGKFKRDRTNVIVFPTLPRSSCFELETKRLKLELAITLGSYVPRVIRWGQ